jgi:ribonuclease Z
MKITFLGTSDQIPSANRNHSSILLNYKDENILVDCGEGTQRQMRKAKLNPCKVTRILITHWHADHVLGISGFLSTLSLSGYNKTLFIYGPKGIKKQISELLKLFPFFKSYPIKVEEVSGKFLDLEEFFLEAKLMEHSIACNSYNFVKKNKRRINKKLLEKTNLPNGPIISQLKEGKDITYKNKKYKAKDLTYLEKGIKISFVLDTKLNTKIYSFVKDADILISECTYSKDLEKQAKEHFHLTTNQVGKIAKKARIKKLVLTHISQRYENDLNTIKKEVEEEFKGEIIIAKDLQQIERF